MEHQPQLYQVLEEGKRLLLSVGCVDLENQLTQLGDHWLSSTTKVNKELHRLDSTLKHWSRSESLAVLCFPSHRHTSLMTTIKSCQIYKQQASSCL